MAIGAITYSEIEAYQRLMFVRLSAWDIRLIRRLDNAVQAVMLGTKPVPTNVKAMKAMLRGVVAAKAAQQGKGDASSEA